MQVRNYTTSRNMWAWSGVRTYNMLWSLFILREPMIVHDIEIHWGGYGQSTRGRHFIAHAGPPSDIPDLRGHVVASATVNIGQGRKWRKISVNPTFLEAGRYAIGIWAEPSGRRTVSEWVSDYSSLLYTHTNTSYSGSVKGRRWRGNGILPVRLNGESSGNVKVRVGGSWRDGQVYVRAGGSWRKSKGIWVKSGGTWRRSK